MMVDAELSPKLKRVWNVPKATLDRPMKTEIQSKKHHCVFICTLIVQVVSQADETIWKSANNVHLRPTRVTASVYTT